MENDKINIYNNKIIIYVIIIYKNLNKIFYCKINLNKREASLFFRIFLEKD